VNDKKERKKGKKEEPLSPFPTIISLNRSSLKEAHECAIMVSYMYEYIRERKK